MELNENNAELIGAIIGDGNIYKNYKKYRIGFTGNIINDRLYFEYLKGLILTEWKKDARIHVAGRGLRIIINSKEVCNFLTEELKIPHSKGKCEKVTIPAKIMEDWNLARRAIRGIADTDGTVFVSKKPGVDRYPCIEISTVSESLAAQLKFILEQRGFRVNKIRRSISKMSKLVAKRVVLNGKNNLRKWIDEIGFSNPYKMQRAISYI